MADQYAQAAPATRLKQALSTVLVTQNLRYWIIAIWGFALGFSVDWRLAAIWASAASAVTVIRGEVERAVLKDDIGQPTKVLTILATVTSLLWAVAPLMAWNTGQTWAQMIAMSMMLAAFLMVFTQFGHNLRQAFIVNSPYTAVAAWIALHMKSPAEFWPFAICVLVLGGAMHANILFWRVHRAMIDRYQAKQAALITELEVARDSANAANAAKSAFLAMISHELRTPMNGVLGAAQLLGGADLAPAQRRYVDMIRTSGDALLAQLNDILDFAKIESGRIELEKIQVPLGELVEKVGAVWSAGAEAKGLHYAVRVADDLPILVLSDPTRLSQIIHNLLSNATKFTDEGAVGITVSGEKVGEARARIAIAVSDTGMGISTADQARLFRPFSQIDSSSTRRFGGTGLGLVISRRLAGLLGGTLEVRSVPNEGSVFTLTLEVDVLQWSTADAPPESETEPVAEILAGRPLRVLVAEDHAINRKLLTLWLEMEGHTHACAENGQMALELSAAQAFDVVLMDVNMPVMDGLTAVRAIRGSRGPNRETPIIMLSASVRAEDYDAGAAAGANAYLAKPIDFVSLRGVLADTLREDDEVVGPVSAIA